MNWQERFLRLSLYQAGKLRQVLSEDISVTFNTTEAVSGGLNEANIVIGGLKTDTMFYLATSNTQWVQNWVNNRIVIDAGYKSNHGIVFDGTIVEAKPNLSTADYSVTIKAMSMFQELMKPQSYTFAGEQSINDIAKRLAGDLGLSLVSDVDDSVKVNNYSIRDESAVNAIRLLAQTTGMDIYENKGRLVLKKPNFGIQRGSEIIINSSDIIGIPEPTPYGVDINVRMNTSFTSGTRVRVNSFRYPQLQSYKFFIMAMSHAGATKGREWITHLNLIKEGMGYW